jgi:FkbH-like protein
MERLIMDADLTESPNDDEEFDEIWYLSHNQDVAEAVRLGRHQSGRDHYESCGRREGRMPVPPANADLRSRAAPVSDPDADAGTPPFWRHNGVGFLTPTDLAVSPTRLDRVAMIGSCMLQGWRFHERNISGCPVDLFTVGHVSSMPELSSEAIATYDFVVVQVPLREVLRDDTFWHLSYSDVTAHEAAFKTACDTLEYCLNTRMKWNHETGLLTFVTNFFVPQQNPMGRLFPRYDIRNSEYFIDRLNEHLELIVRRNRNAYVLDLDRISASAGRRFTQDDSLCVSSHNSALSAESAVLSRIEPIESTPHYYDLRWQGLIPDMVWSELLAMYRTVRQTDAVKLVVVDLDDTIWNGISGEMQTFDVLMVEGWPLGVAEALQYLKKRGILLAIISKNEESRIRAIWPSIYRDRLTLADFAAVRINWSPKIDNMREILEGMNLLPRNVVFIDDNPAEREAMRIAFPDMRILGRHPYYLKRILLWSSETQVPIVTEESGTRTEMVQAQLVRETKRKEMTREQFLMDAAPVVSLVPIDTMEHDRFARAFELINKTNQFNTTGRRWKFEEFEELFRTAGQMLAFEVADKFTTYGLVGVVIFHPGRIEQWVMSCRVLGYQIEEAVMATIVARMRKADPGPVIGRLIRTDLNFPCRDLFRRCGFTDPNDTGEWMLNPDVTPEMPQHVKIGQAVPHGEVSR